MQDWGEVAGADSLEATAAWCDGFLGMMVAKLDSSGRQAAEASLVGWEWAPSTGLLLD